MNTTSKQVVRIILTIAVIAGLAYGLWLIRSIIIYILLAAVLTIIGKPIVDRLTDEKWKKIHINRNIAAAFTMALMLGVAGGVMSIFIPSLLSELAVISEINVERLFSMVEENISDVQKVLHRGKPVEEEEENIMSDALNDLLNFQNFTGTFQTLAGGIGNLLFAVFSILFITFFFLREKSLFRNIILAIVPDEYEENILRISPRLKHSLSRYFIGLLIQITLFTTLISIGLYLIGFDNFIAIAFFAGLINVIPYLGPIIGCLFGLIVGLSANMTAEMTMDPLGLSVLIIIVFAAVQLIDNFVMQPVIFSNSINAHPLEIFLVISIAAILGGIPAMIAAVPTYSVIRLLAREFFPNVKMIRRLTQNLKYLDNEGTH